MSRQKKKGFTLVELVVVLVIMTVILGIAIPSVLHYMKMAEFRKNEENAKTVYLAAESKLTYYRSSGQWEEFKKEVMSQGKEAPFTDSKRKGKIYGITLDKEHDGASASNNAVLGLLDGYTYDKSMLDASIAIEIDIESGEVYSAFYGTRCKGLNYASQDGNGYLTMADREYKSRKDRVLGYYSVEDTVNVVALKPTRLKMNTISLLNGEVLSLNWSSNVGNRLDVEYDIQFYQKNGKDKEDSLLFSMAVAPAQLRSAGWDTDSSKARNMVPVELKDAEGKSAGTWYFPITLQDGKYVLTLDAMMSAEILGVLSSSQNKDGELDATTSTSILRLAKVAESLKEQQTIYACIQAVPYYQRGSQSTNEYRSSEKVTSNSSNTLYGDDSTENKIKVVYFRHLSNIRYEEEDTKKEITLTNRNMDWSAVGTGLYTFALQEEGDGQAIRRLVWYGNEKDKTADFPTIAKLDGKDTLTGKGKNTKISNLSLGEDSVVKDNSADTLEIDAANYLGLFGEIEGTVKNITFQDPVLKLTTSQSKADHDKLKGAGILAGRTEGNLNDITVEVKKEDHVILHVSMEGSHNALGIGGLVGVLADEERGQLGAVKKAEISNICVSGVIRATLPEITVTGDVEDAAAEYAYGIGGVVGYAYMDSSAKKSEAVITDCENHSNIYGNYFTGGIIGNVHGNDSSGETEDIAERANVRTNSNGGLIQCTADAKDTSLCGHYFGGIAGYADQVLIYKGSSASGRAGGFSYNETKKDQLKGQYVGGIIGYGQSTILSSCSTKKNGYILGDKYVGGIAGGFRGAIRADGEVQVTTNASYVIGNSYVGGIVGKNTENVTIENCVNNGVAAGYDRYIGGITGYNDATIADCASYLSDYNNSIFKMIVSAWKATGDYAGGITGYNNGRITFSKESQKITVKSVSSIVAGENYVGGIAGFNDVAGTLDVNYTLIGGKVYAYGDCAGGGFGFNASTEVLNKELTIKPTSVQGRYYVGGCIGANVVNLSKDLTMEYFRADNRLGSIVGEAFCGGIIGYQRTYTAEQFGTGALLDEMDAQQSAILPGIDGKTNLPGAEAASENTHTLTIRDSRNENNSLQTITNNIPIRAWLYVGGIVGYCENNSKLVISNCVNEGTIGTPANDDTQHTHAKNGVNLATFIAGEVDGRQLADGAADVTICPIGGIIGVNLKNQVIEHCTNKGTITGTSGIGGIVGLNAGGVRSCNLTENFGSTSISYLGGISGINLGTITECTTKHGKTVSGKSNVGGITGWNLNGGAVTDSSSYANITGDGDQVGGLTGRNSGMLQIQDESSNSPSRTIRGKKNVGGLTGMNEAAGTITVSGTSGEQIAAGNGITVNGTKQVGGIAGDNQGELQGSAGAYLVSSADKVHATQGLAGGIAGVSEGSIRYAASRCGSVQADEGEAGGITGVNRAGQGIRDCINYGNVTSSDGYAGGITATNAGTITDCQVKAADKGTLKIHSAGVKESGAICGINTGVISAANDSRTMADNTVILSGKATIYGGITGSNQGSITGVTLTAMPQISTSENNLTIGGIAGENKNSINNVSTELKFENFSSYRYLGGIVGSNKAGTIQNATFTGKMTEKNGSAGNCYGGIAGINKARLSSCKVGTIYMNINGVYTATSTSTAEQKEKMATHAGGVAGKNESDAVITGCTIANDTKSQLIAKYGMLGGITGYNKGSVTLSGTTETEQVFADVHTVDELQAKASGVVSVDQSYIRWESGKNQTLEQVVYNNTNTKVSENRLKMYMDKNGNLGGIIAFNSTDGQISKCMSGNWFLSNKSTAIGVGTGGIIGMNESEKDITGLVNAAFVGRQLASADTNRFAGGIIGNQNNSTSSDWGIENCINYGTVYCYNTHYAGGIMGQWTGTGGTIQNCRNYGMLQTTYGTDWVGASAGIVAQLYHAYEGNTYNIIGCRNYGSIYTREGEKSEDRCGANDSAGILGNITTYRADSVSDAPSFTVQILDCANEPGVKIYSGSMASGIFGFLSCDNPNKDSITKSTGNVNIRVERCRNFAKVLKGHNYSCGIFGDRYGSNGWNNTVVKDCYGVHVSSSYYNGKNGGNGYPVFGYGNAGNSSWMQNSDRVNNFFIENVDNWGFTNVRIGESESSLKNGSGSAENGYLEQGYNGRYTTSLFVMYDITNGKYFLADILPSVLNGTVEHTDYQTIYWENGKPKVTTVIKGNSQYIDPEDWFIKADDGAKLAKIICYLDTATAEMIKYNSVEAFTANALETADNTFYQDLRESWRRLEGIEAGKILQPKEAKANISDGKITVKITPQDRKARDLDLNQDSQTYDPFLYEVKLSGSGKTVVQKIYSEEESFALPAGMSGDVKLQIRAVSMFEDVDPSDWFILKASDINKVLPDPDVEIHLVEDEKGFRGYSYQYSLKNLEDYTQVDEDGEAVYPDWQVRIHVQGLGETVLDAQHQTGTIPVKDKSNPIYQMVAKATAKTGSAELIQDSREVSTPIYILYYYRPPITLKTWEPQVKTSWELTGDTLEKLRVKVTLDATGKAAMNTPPIYRVELVGDWKEQKDIVLAKEDVLLVSGGSAGATLSDLPSYLAEAKNIRLRIWYASSGLGPVYTYYPLEAGDDAINVSELVNVDQDGKEEWSYSHSTVLSEYSKQNVADGVSYFDPYIYDSQSALWNWLPAPVLDDTDTLLTPEITSDGKIYYTFTWDTGVNGTDNASYQVALTGIDAKGREVTIDAKDAYKSGKSFRIDATDWNYTSVKLKVTRVGEEKKKQIGLSTTGTYQIRQRLEKPGQPTVQNMDVNELDYQISWTPLSSEDGCEGYQAYVQMYDGDQPGKARKLGELVKAGTQTDGTYKERLFLDESYAGKTVVIYLVAKADPSGNYLDSENGVTYQLTIPKRLDTPVVTWKVNWGNGKSNAIEAADFRAGGLTVSLSKTTVLPGGSTYLLKGYVYDTKAAAEAAVAGGDPQTNASATYPALNDEVLDPVGMDMDSTGAYHHDLEDFSITNAGKYIVFYVRSSSGAGNLSSLWVNSEVYQLPYVKLEAPDITSDRTEGRTVTVQTTSNNPDLPAATETWNMTSTALEWNSVEGADICQMTLSGTVQVQNGNDISSRKLNSQIRILENYKGNLLTVQQKDANGNWSAASVTDQQEIIQTADPQKPRIIHHFMLDSYQTQISSSYSLNGVQNYYQLTLTAELLAEQQEDGTFHYTLFLPDAEQMDNGAGTTITNENFSLTDQVSAEANVVSDIWPTGLAGEDTSQKPKEQPYVKSDETQILFQ